MGELVLSWRDKEKRREEIVFPEEGYKWNELGKLAQKFYRDFAEIKAYETLLARLKDPKRHLLELVESFSNEDLYGKAWYGEWTRGRRIQFNTASPYKNASGRLNTIKSLIRPGLSAFPPSGAKKS